MNDILNPTSNIFSARYSTNNAFFYSPEFKSSTAISFISTIFSKNLSLINYI